MSKNAILLSPALLSGSVLKTFSKSVRAAWSFPALSAARPVLMSWAGVPWDGAVDPGEVAAGLEHAEAAIPAKRTRPAMAQPPVFLHGIRARISFTLLPPYGVIEVSAIIRATGVFRGLPATRRD